MVLGTEIKDKNRQRLKKVFGFLLGACLVILFYFKADFTWSEVLCNIIDSGWLILSGATFFTLALFYISTVKWQIILNDLGCKDITIPFTHLFHFTSLGFISSFFLPRAVSDVGIKSLLLNKRYSVPYKTGVYSVLLDQFFNFIVSFIFLLPAIALMSDINNMNTVIVLNIIGLGFFSVIFYYFSKPVLRALVDSYEFVIKLIRNLPFLRHRRSGEVSIITSDLDIRDETARRLYLLTLIRQLSTVLRLYVIVLFLNIDLSFYFLLVSCSVMLLFGLITIIPAQLGIGEWGWYGMLALAGLPDPQIVMFVLSTRIYSNLSILIIFIVSWFLNKLYGSGYKQNGYREIVNLNYK